MESKNKSSKSEIAKDLTTVSYVANSEGYQELVPGTFWNPVNVVNHQAWQEIEKQIEVSKRKIQAGRVSCLHYYMTANQMDTSLLAKYTGQSRWLVRLHLIPLFFHRLSAKTLKIYANLFKVTPDDLSCGNLNPPIYNLQEHGCQSIE